MTMYTKPTSARIHYILRNKEAWSYQGRMIQPMEVEIFDELNAPIVIQFHDNNVDSDGEIVVEAKSLETLSNATKTIKAIWSAYARATKQERRDWQSMNLQQLKIALDQMKAVQIYYDNRDYPNYRTIEQIEPSDCSRWMDDYHTMQRDNGCTFSVVAETRQTAQHLMLAEFTKADNDRHNDYLIQWLQAGKPVIIDHNSHYPDIVSWSDCSAV